MNNKYLGEEIRRDTIRVVKPYDKIIEQIKEKNDLKKNAEAYRFAFDTYVKSEGLINEFKELKNEIGNLKEMIEDLNFVIRTKLLTEQK